MKVVRRGGQPLGLAAVFIEGLTLVTLIGTLLLIGVFAFLFLAERKMKSKDEKR